MIKAFLFDYDGVITRGVPDGTLSNRLAKNLGVFEETASEWIAPLWVPLLKGEMSEKDLWQVFEEKYGKSISAAQRDIWFKWNELVPLPEMIALVRDLRAQGYPVGVLSNATMHTKEEIRRNGGYDNFDFVVISSEVAAKKPDPAIFNIALKNIPGIKPGEVLFLDDRESATLAADKLGFKTILVKDHAQAISRVGRYMAPLEG